MIADILPFIQVILLDICLSGDNAVVIAMAAMSLAPKQRTAAIVLGTIAAVLFRVAFSLVAVKLLHFPLVSILGAVALFWVAWNMFLEIIIEDEPGTEATTSGSLLVAILAIVFADVSMSIDNVLAVSAAARGHIYAMVFGLVLSIGLMAVAATIITRFLERWPILKWIGLGLIVWIAGGLLFDNYGYLLEHF